MRRRVVGWVVIALFVGLGVLPAAARAAGKAAAKAKPVKSAGSPAASAAKPAAPAAAASAGSAVVPRVPGAHGPYVWILQPDDCNPGLRHQPEGPFATLVFCEQSLGVYLVVAYLETMGAPRRTIGAWSVGDRVWQDSTWAADVTSFAWTPDGQSLIVATADNYGTGGVFELDLLRRQARQIEPVGREATLREPGPGYVLERMDLETGVLHYHALPWNLPAGAAAADSLLLAPKR